MLIGIGLLSLTVPTYWTLANTVWTTDEQGHGPVILAITMWLAWDRREQLLDLPDQPALVAGWFAFGIGATAYIVGRSQQVNTLEVFAHLPLLMAALLLTKGKAGLRWGTFFLFFLLFMVPLPGLFVQSITMPLKLAVSHVAENVMHLAGYPVARSGVVLYVGQYQMLVADACAGLNSMFTLEALGLLYMNIVKSTSIKRNVALALLVIPIAFAANVVRVIILIGVTFHLGDEAGQGFAHGFAGISLFVVALTLMLMADEILRRVFNPDMGSAGGAKGQTGLTLETR